LIFHISHLPAHTHFYSLFIILEVTKKRGVQVEATLPKNDSKTVEKQVTASTSIRGQSKLKSGVQLSKEVRYLILIICENHIFCNHATHL